MKKKSNVLEEANDWFMNVRWIEGISDTVNLYLFIFIISIIFIGYDLNLYKGYFEFTVIASILIMFIYRWDLKISKSDNGFFSLNNWIIGALSIIGLMNKDYKLVIYGFRTLGIFIAMWIIIKLVYIIYDE